MRISIFVIGLYSLPCTLEPDSILLKRTSVQEFKQNVATFWAENKPSKTIEKVADRLFGRYPEIVQNFLEQYGNEPIHGLEIRRRPLSNTLSNIAFRSDKDLRQAIKERGYDNLYHSWIGFKIQEKSFVIEKSIALHIQEAKPNDGEMISIPDSPVPITISQLLEKAIQIKGEDQILKYDTFTANCQQFIVDVLGSSDLLPPEALSFFFQDTVNSFTPSRPFKKAMDIVTDGTVLADRFAQAITDGKLKLRP